MASISTLQRMIHIHVSHVKHMFEKGIDLDAPPVLSLKKAITAMMLAQGGAFA
jgi:hypothetical protein